MKKKIFTLIKIYAAFVVLFILQKPLFMAYYWDRYGSVDFVEWLKVMYHGIPLDLSIAGYLTALPVLFTLFTVWMHGGWYRIIMKGYMNVITFVLSFIFVIDLGLYNYWGFRLDSTPFFYLQNPSDAMASVPLWMLFVMPIFFFAYWYLSYRWMRLPIPPSKEELYSKKRGVESFVFIILLGLLFIPIRGGVTVSTMNVGHVYYSSNMSLNHAAINPAFSLMTSLTKQNDFAKQYRFLPDQEVNQIFSKLKNQEITNPVTLTDTLLTTSRPNVVLIVLESFSGIITESLGGIKGVAPNINKYYEEGIGFMNFYANSFRTDRGLVSILSGYPAQPTTSIMKYPGKTQTLPSISASLKREGYSTEFLYGGDANFTNMRSYFIGAGIDKIVSDQDFPVSQRLSKWGVRDDQTFSYLSKDILQETHHPFMKMFLTLSSHEPFDVPMKKFDDPYLNSVAYTDSCIGVFLDELKASKIWDKTLVILLPDHCMHYPATISISDPKRYHIPMIWTGGAIRTPKKVYTTGSQIDLAATLLAQMGIKTADFEFSKNLFDSKNAHFGFYSFKDGFGVIKDTSHFVYNCESDQSIPYGHNTNALLENDGKAFLQHLYDDLDKR